MGEGLRFGLLLFFFTFLSSLTHSLILYLPILSFPFMSVANPVHICWTFMCSSPFPRFSQNWGFTIWLWTEITCVMSKGRHLKARVPSPSCLASDLGSRVWREQNHEVARTWILESLWLEVSACQLALNSVWERNKLSLCWTPEVWGFICYHSIV